MKEEIVLAYEKLLDTLGNARTSVAKRVKAVDEFFERHPTANIDDLAENFGHKDDAGITRCFHPYLLLADLKDNRAPVNDGNFAVLQCLLENGVPPHPEVNIPDPFRRAVVTGDHRTAALLLKHGADSNLLGEMCRPVLFDAVCNNDYKMINLLLDNKGDINIKAGSFKYSSGYDNYTVLGYLYKCCLPSDPKQEVCHTFTGSKKDVGDMLRFLESRELNPNARMGKNNLTFSDVIKAHGKEVDTLGFNWRKWAGRDKKYYQIDNNR